MMTYTTFAQSYKLTPNQAVVLPALFEKAAREMDMTIQQLVVTSIVNREVGEYLAEVAETVASKYLEEA